MQHQKPFSGWRASSYFFFKNIYTSIYGDCKKKLQYLEKCLPSLGAADPGLQTRAWLHKWWTGHQVSQSLALLLALLQTATCSRRRKEGAGSCSPHGQRAFS